MRTLPLIAAVVFSACGFVDFGRKVSDDELRLRASVRAYYDEVALAFATGNHEALTLLFDAPIAKPMTRAQISNWGRNFFTRHGTAAFKVVNLDFERLGYENAVVVLTYRVTTKDGTGDFGGMERDYLAKRGKRWTITAWEKLAEPKPAP